MSKAIHNVTVHRQSSMISLNWHDANDFHYHIWADRDGTFNNPTNLFKNRDNGSLKTYDPGYYRCHHLNVNAKANAAMIAEAKRIADAGDMLKLANGAWEIEQSAEQADLTERVRKNTRAKELFTAMQAHLDDNATHLFALNADDVACLLIYRPKI